MPQMTCCSSNSIPTMLAILRSVAEGGSTVGRHCFAM